MVLAPYVMGIDLGTTTCRCAIFDLHGTELASAYREILVRYPRPLWPRSTQRRGGRAPSRWCVRRSIGSSITPTRSPGWDCRA